ncbi:diaminopropionate ammonia-lyase [Oricola indica]|uniref:diaminopropionate ammonia-lyase n=1 Tax=Oricola indica TaxID=2872591 RepID=UPI003CCBE104
MSNTSELILLTNPLARREAPWTAAQDAILNDAGFARAKATITAWPGYAPTPLASLGGIAAVSGIGALYYKDEASRFGLGSFKALGGAYAVWRVLCDTAAEKGISPDDREAFTAHARTLTVTCATDGNHGRSVAWGAQTFGCNCVIFIHATVSEGRKREIERYGARIVRSAGNYDDSVHEAQVTADREGWIVVSDTSYEGYTDIPKDVMQGYELMAAEAIGQWPEAGPPTHIFLQTGVGGLAAAVAAQYWRRYGADRPMIVLVDPLQSACWLESIRAGQPTAVKGDLDTLMAGLACGEISALAWEILRHCADAVVGLSDDAAVDGMRMLAEGRHGDAPLVAGESAVAGLMALVAAAADPEARVTLQLDIGSRVLVFGTEGATDPGLYREIVGRSPEAIRERLA